MTAYTRYFEETLVNPADQEKALMEALITVGKRAYPKFGTAVIMAGGGGSGKGFVLSNLLGVEGKVFDVDAMKTLTMKTPAVVEKLKKTFGVDISKLNLRTPENVGKLHVVLSEAGLIDKKNQLMFDSIISSPADRLPNVIFDVTLKEHDKFSALCTQLQALGYEKQNIHLVWVVNDVNVAVEQNAKRSRVVPEDILKKTHVGATTTMYGLLSDASHIRSAMDGDIVFAFNKAGIDSTMIKSGDGGKYVSSASYIYVKRQGKAPLSPRELGTAVLQKITDYTPGEKTWGQLLKVEEPVVQ